MIKAAKSIKNPFLLVISMCALGVTTVSAAPIQEYFYETGKIYSIYTGAGIATQIEIDPKEQVKDFGTGFSNGWDLVRRENIFYLKPKDLESDTNMYIRTDKRVYLFDLKIVSRNWKKLDEAKAAGVNYRVNFTYPTEVSVSEVKSKDRRAPSVKTNDGSKASAQITGYENYNMKYDVSSNSSSAWLAPTKVYDDGNFTYIYFDGISSFPAVYGRKKDKTSSEFLLNSTVENNVLIVHGTYPFLVLRHGDNVVGLRRN